MEQQELIPHLFRTEFRKIVAVLCKHLGIQYIQAAEDIASDTFALAFETWSYRGLPDNPVAWLYTVAKNKAKNQIARNIVFETKVASGLKQQSALAIEPEIDLSDENITDSQLQMLFAVCHPSISTEAQVGLALRILCGFGIDEIANAFLTNKDTINKRLFRAKEILRSGQSDLSFPSADKIAARLDAVLTTLYLLFSEGYYSESRDAILRDDCCLEAMRLTYLLIENETTNLPAVNALFALMCFHASRFDARKSDNGEIILYQEQDEALWNRDLIDKGIYYLHRASHGTSISRYHLEANIAYWHTIKEDSAEKWENILQLYNLMLQVAYSPVAALNRTYALAKANGYMAAIAEAEKLNLENNHFYFALLGELYCGIDRGKSIAHFERAAALAKTNTDKQTLRKKIQQLK